MKDIKTFKTMLIQLLRIVNSHQRVQLIWMLVIIIIGSLMELIGVSIILPFIQAILTPLELANKPYIRPIVNFMGIKEPSDMIVLTGIIIILVYLIKNGFLAFSQYMQALISNDIQKELSVSMMNSYMRRPYSYYSVHGSGEIMRGISSDVSGVFLVIQNMFRLISEGLVALMIAVYLAFVDVQLAIWILFFGAICAALIVFVLKKRITRMSVIQRETAAECSKWIIEAVSGIKEIIVFGKEDYYTEGYRLTQKRSFKAQTNYTFVCSLPERIIETVCISGIIISVLVRLMSGIDPNSFVISLAAFAMGSFRILPSISRLTGYMNGLVYARPMLEAAYENISEAKEYADKLKQISVENDLETPIAFSDKVEIKALDWQYESGKGKVLSNLNLTINKGDVIGIVGESGAGKSTLSDLLLQLYTPDEGAIFMDGVDIRKIPKTWSRTVSFVPQSVFLMDDTVRKNVAFGETDIDEDKVWNVLNKASIADFIRGLPDGLETIVGERGIKFSGGQKQRIAIARALYFSPKILVLDEATSALDNETENSVMDAIEKLAGEITLIIIAHRVTTLKSCNKIYEIKDGKAVECNKDVVINGNRI